MVSAVLPDAFKSSVWRGCVARAPSPAMVRFGEDTS